MTSRDEFKAMAFGPGKQLAATDPDAYLDHIDATNRPDPARVAQGIEQPPPKRKVAGSTPAARIQLEVCGFCKGQPVGNAATWLDGKPRPPAACPRCGETNYPADWPNNERYAA
jgi:hypothetical protein